MFKLVRNEKLNHEEIESVKVYENDYYSLRIFHYKNGYISKDLRKNIEGRSNFYTPPIYLQTKDDCLVYDLKIETYSCGSMDRKELKNVIEAYKIAIESANELEEILKENNLYKED